MFRFILFLLLIQVPLWGDNSVKITDVSGQGQDRPITLHRCFVQGEITRFPRPRIGGMPTTEWQVNVNRTWPDNSVACAYITFLMPLGANQQLTVDFVNDRQPCHLGSVATCEAAALSRAAMLNFNGSRWESQIETTGINATVSAREMLSQLNPQYILRGPLVTRVVVGETDREFDFGSDKYKSLHPIWVLSFWQGQSAVLIDAILEGGMWTDAVQDQTYAVTVKAGPPGALVERWKKAQFRHWARSRWRRQFWSGTGPGDVNVDHNFAYLKSTKLIPNYDPKRTNNVASQVATLLRDWRSSDKGEPFSTAGMVSGGIAFGMGGTGARGEIGYLMQWQVAWLYSMDKDMYDLITAQADLSANFPIHYREAAPRGFFDSDLNGSPDQGSAFGKFVSIDARPSFSGRAGTLAGDAINPVAPLGSTPWGMDGGHFPAVNYLPWLVTGDWYLMSEGQQLASYMLWAPASDVICYERHRNWGFIQMLSGSRYHAWPFRSLAMGYLMSNSDSIEAAYFLKKINTNIEVMEGMYGYTDGSFFNPNPGGNAQNPCPNYKTTTSTPWCWGFTDVSHQAPFGKETYSLLHTDNPLRFIGLDQRDPSASEFTNPAKASFTGSPWMDNYERIVEGELFHAGFANGRIVQHQAEGLIQQILSPDYYPYLVTAYRWPLTPPGPPNPNFAFFKDWASIKNAYTDALIAKMTCTKPSASCWMQMNDNALGTVGGYLTIALGASSYLPGRTSGPYSGSEARAWLETNGLPFIPNDGNNMWLIVPRATEPSATVPVPRR
jgi:hypothetical protein